MPVLDDVRVLEVGDFISVAQCGKLLADFRVDRNSRSHVWLRWFNEAPVLLLCAIIILVVVKPF